MCVYTMCARVCVYVLLCLCARVGECVYVCVHMCVCVCVRVDYEVASCSWTGRRGGWPVLQFLVYICGRRSLGGLCMLLELVYVL